MQELTIVKPDVAKDGLLKVLAAAEAVALQDVFDQAVEALNNAIGLRVHRRSQAMLDVEVGAAAVEIVVSGRGAAAKAEQAIGELLAVARRKLKEIFGHDGSEIAAEGLRRIAELYRTLAEIRGMGPGQRPSVRQVRTAPLVAAFGEWLQLQCRRVSMKSRLGEKLAYIHRHWDGLQTFLRDGHVEIDSNNVENLIRKNALFAGHDEGGRSWARIASLIATAKINGVEPFAYLKATLEAAAAYSHPQSCQG